MPTEAAKHACRGGRLGTKRLKYLFRIHASDRGLRLGWIAGRQEVMGN